MKRSTFVRLSVLSVQHKYFQLLKYLVNHQSSKAIETSIFGSIPILSKEISNIKKGEPIPVNQFSDCVTSAELLRDPYKAPL